MVLNRKRDFTETEQVRSARLISSHKYDFRPTLYRNKVQLRINISILKSFLVNV